MMGAITGSGLYGTADVLSVVATSDDPLHPIIEPTVAISGDARRRATR